MQNLLGNKEEVAIQQKITAQIRNADVEHTPLNNGTVPAFDFSGKQQYTIHQVKEKAKAVEVKPTDNSGVGKPKFDLDKGKHRLNLEPQIPQKLYSQSG